MKALLDALVNDALQTKLCRATAVSTLSLLPPAFWLPELFHKIKVPLLQCPTFQDRLTVERKKGERKKGIRAEKGDKSNKHDYAFFGRPLERNVDSRPSLAAVCFCHDSDPNGRPRFTLTRNASSSESVSTPFT